MRTSPTHRFLPFIATCLVLGAPHQGRCECRPAGAADRVHLPRSPASVAELAAWIAPLACKNVVYSAVVATRAGTATIVAPDQPTVAQALEVFVDAMSALGLVVRQSRLSIVVSVPSTWRAPAETGPTAGPATPIVPRAAALDLADQIRWKTDGVEVSRALFEAVLADPTMFGRSARTDFHAGDAGQVGLRLVKVEPGLLWDRLGLKNGDIVRRVNGIAMTRAEQALMAFVSLRGQREVTLEVWRRGKSLTLRCRVLDARQER